MHPGIEPTFRATDFQGFAGLRRLAREGDESAARAVAQQFEALFISQLLGQMRDAASAFGGPDDVPGAGAMDGYHRMHDQQLALGLAQGPGLGLADAILRQLGVEEPVPPTSGLRASPAAVSAERFAPADEAEFVAAVWPHARRAAEALGVSPEVVVAQAALETGWGRHQPRHPDGRDSFNLFGIKAGPEWPGERIRVPTLEFVDSVPERRAAAFRAYDDLGAGFDDYVRFVSGSERYRAALSAGSDAGFVQALAAGGYATDPRYADKVVGILQRGLPGWPDPAPGREPEGAPTGAAAGAAAQVSAAADDNPSRTAAAAGGSGDARTAG